VGLNQRDALDRATHSVAHTLKPSSFYYVYTHSNISDTYRLAVSTSGEPTKECPDIADKLIYKSPCNWPMIQSKRDAETYHRGIEAGKIPPRPLGPAALREY
jgi:hypothetical protein